MLKFKKVFTYRVISLIVGGIFFLNSTTHGIELSQKSYLRKQLDFNDSSLTSRVLETLSKYFNSKNIILKLEEKKARIKKSIRDRGKTILMAGSFSVLAIGLIVYLAVKECQYRPYRNFIKQYSVEYSGDLAVSEYLSLMEENIKKRVPTSEKDWQWFYYKTPLYYMQLGSKVGRLMHRAVSYELFKLIKCEDVDYLLQEGNEKLFEIFVKDLISKNVSIERLLELSRLDRDDILLSSIAKKIIDTIGPKNTEDLKKVESICRSEKSLPIIRAKLGKLISQNEEILNNKYSKQLFVIYVAGATYKYLLDMLYIDDENQRQEIFNKLCDVTFLIFKDWRIAGCINIMGGLEIDLDDCNNPEDAMSIAVHEAIHRIYADSDFRSYFGMIGLKPFDDIRWLFSSSIGEHVYRLAIDYLSEPRREIIVNWGDHLGTFTIYEASRGMAPIETHSRLRTIPPSLRTWKEVIEYINDPNSGKGGTSFGDEPEISYMEGRNLGTYTSYYFKKAGSYFLTLYATEHDTMNFAEMELAAGVMRNIIEENLDANISRRSLHEMIIREVKKNMVKDNTDYDSLGLMEARITAKIKRDINSILENGGMERKERIGSGLEQATSPLNLNKTPLTNI